MNISATLIVIAAAAGYIMGALPFGYLIARARGMDIFAVGSKSSGATNVRRMLGARAGNAVFVLDVLKGAIAAGWPLYFVLAARGEPAFAQAAALQTSKLLGSVGLVAALLGHSFSCFTGFKGGKGVAAGAGGFLVLMPPVTLIAAAVWVATFYCSCYVSLASIFAAVTLPVASVLFGEPFFITSVTLAVMVFVIVRHRANVVRLLNGTENKADRKGRKDRE